MVDIDALRAELAKPEYAGLTDEAIAHAINAAQDPVAVDVPIALVEGYLRRKGLVFALTRFLASPGQAPPEIQAVAFELVNMIQSPRLSTIEMSKPDIAADVQTMLGALGPQGAGLLSDDDLAAILAMAVGTRPRWQRFSHRELDWADVAQARGA